MVTIMQLCESFGFQCLPGGYQYEWYSDVKDKVKIAGVTTGAGAEMWLQLYSEANKTTWSRFYESSQAMPTYRSYFD